MYGKNNLQQTYDHHPNLTAKQKQIRRQELSRQYKKALSDLGLKKAGSNKRNSENLENLENIDKAFELGRKINKKSRGMSTWDFDDTLVNTKSGVGYRLPNPNYKPGTGNWYDFAHQHRIPWENTAKKVIFMAGPPGSGKSNVIKQLNLKGIGMQIVAADVSLQKLIKEAGLPADMKSYTPEQQKQKEDIKKKALELLLMVLVLVVQD